jgi:hypothetical protein
MEKDMLEFLTIQAIMNNYRWTTAPERQDKLEQRGLQLAELLALSIANRGR